MSENFLALHKCATIFWIFLDDGLREGVRANKSGNYFCATVLESGKPTRSLPYSACEQEGFVYDNFWPLTLDCHNGRDSGSR
ncbi:MAG: hypothetical protein RMX68_008725 [Aulosira sp. ZfuVER01]|nr:hypothetical protein [Aulosira sp. ZfuVER01]MDZ7998639.1 hypothetical protein [Aulosira sp. DedVER01a]MDZ8054811.1 hypothetical protein [Aulosira sp. ZfuCHP01]